MLDKRNVLEQQTPLAQKKLIVSHAPFYHSGHRVTERSYHMMLAALPALMSRFVLLEVVWAWARAVHRHRALSRRYPERYRLVRFEEVVSAPQATLDELRMLLDRASFADLLLAISGESDGVLLSSIIVEPDTGEPTDDFLLAAMERGLLEPVAANASKTSSIPTSGTPCCPTGAARDTPWRRRGPSWRTPAKP